MEYQTKMYDASRKWSNTQWAKFLQCDKCEIPSIRRYLRGKQPGIFYTIDCRVFPWDNGWDMYWQLETLYKRYHFETYEQAIAFTKDFLTRCHLTKMQQKMFNLPANAVMMMSINVRGK